MNLKLRDCALFLAAFWIPTNALGLGIRISDQHPQATARGNAFAATADNPSAIYYNPAGLTQLSGQHAVLGLYGVHLNSDFTGPDGRSFDTKDRWDAVPQLFYSFTPKDEPFALGLGLYAPYGLGLEWPDEAPFRHTEGEITYLSFNPVAAWKIAPTLSVAAGFTVNYAEAELEQRIFPRSIFPPGGAFRFDGDGTDLGYNLGLLWKPHPQHAFGLSYRSRTQIEFEGRSQTRGADLLGFPSGSQPAQAVFDFPQHIIVGWSFRPTPRWNLEVNIDWTDWDSLDTVVLRQAPIDVLLPFQWEGSFFYEFGATRYFETGWQVSAGYIFSENSVPDQSFSPLVPDSDRHVFSFGFGRAYQRFRWDAAYQYAYGPERTIRDNRLAFPIGASANGTYEFQSHAFSFSIGYAY